MDWTFIYGTIGGAFGMGYAGPLVGHGADAQQANAEAFYAQMRGVGQRLQPSPEQAAGVARGAQNAWAPIGTTWFHRESARRLAEEKVSGVDWLFWGWLAVGAVACLLRFWMTR